jgi:N,N'-diacetylchitobiose transport system substrate-binding protein
MRTGWPDLVAAANKQFQSDHPGVTVNVQYQTWGTHLQKFDTTLAGGGGPDVIEMGNTEMTKYMAAGAFAALNKSSFDNSSNWLKGLAASGAFGGKTYGVPYYAGSRVVTYRSDLYRRRGSEACRASRSRGSQAMAKNSSTKASRSTSPVPTGTSR